MEKLILKLVKAIVAKYLKGYHLAKNPRRLGGFYPAGIKVLRFRPEVIYGSVEGQGNAVMDIYGQPLRQERHL